MLYDNCWAIRLIAALILTFMSHIGLVPWPQRRFGGLSPPQTMIQAPKLKHENYKWSFVNFYDVKASTGNQKLTLTITSGDFHLGTTWPPLLSRWKSPGVSIPGVWVIFAEKLKVINAGKCSHRWHWQLAHEPCFVLFSCGQVPQRCLVSRFMSSIKCFGLLTQVHAQQGAYLFG